MKINCIQKNGSITLSTLKFREDAVGCSETEVSKDDYQKLEAKTHIPSGIEKGVLTIKENPIIAEKKAEITAKAEIKQKLDAGTATQSDLMEALKLIL